MALRSFLQQFLIYRYRSSLFTKTITLAIVPKQHTPNSVKIAQMLVPASSTVGSTEQASRLSQFKQDRILAYLQVEFHFDPKTDQDDFNIASHYCAQGQKQNRNISIPIYQNEKIKFGRGENCEIRMFDTAVSFTHCMIWSIQFDEESVPLVYLNDKSLNGTYLNGLRIGKNQTALLNADDIIDQAMEYTLMPLEIQFGFKAVFQPISFEDQYNQITKKRFKDWTISSRIIGSGSFGCVYMAKRQNDRKFYAVKIIQYNTKHKDNESEILKNLNHPNIIKIHETHFQDQHILIFEDLICGGDLFSYLVKDGKMHTLPECEAILIVYQILLALKYLHDNNIVHRDLKLDNVLLKTPEPCTKILLADFGIARTLVHPNQRMRSIVGTVEYSAPEIYSSRLQGDFAHYSAAKVGKKGEDNKNGYDSACDIWSLGVLIHKMLSGISPFFEDGEEESMINSAKRGKLDFDVPEWSSISVNGKHFVKSLLNVNNRQRLNCDECFLHPWISSHESNLRKVYETKILKAFD